jgi:hypothetical protein
MFRRISSSWKPVAWALSLGLTVVLTGCGGDSPPAPVQPQAEAKPAPAADKTPSKAGNKKKFPDEEPTAAEKRAARLKAQQGK